MKLKLYLLKKDETLTSFCERINYDITYLSKIAKGKAKPGRKLAEKIKEATGGDVTFEDLMETYNEFQRKKKLKEPIEQE